MNARQLEPPLVRRPSIRAAPRRLITPHERKSAPNWACRVCEVKRIFPVISHW
jgi:hypothetical protein